MLELPPSSTITTRPIHLSHPKVVGAVRATADAASVNEADPATTASPESTNLAHLVHLHTYIGTGDI